MLFQAFNKHYTQTLKYYENVFIEKGIDIVKLIVYNKCVVRKRSTTKGREKENKENDKKDLTKAKLSYIMESVRKYAQTKAIKNGGFKMTTQERIKALNSELKELRNEIERLYNNQNEAIRLIKIYNQKRQEVKKMIEMLELEKTFKALNLKYKEN